MTTTNRLTESLVELEDMPAPSTMGDRVLAGLLVGIIVRVFL